MNAEEFISAFKAGTRQLLGDVETPQDVPLNSGVTWSQLRHRDSETQMSKYVQVCNSLIAAASLGVGR